MAWRYRARSDRWTGATKARTARGRRDRRACRRQLRGCATAETTRAASFALCPRSMPRRRDGPRHRPAARPHARTIGPSGLPPALGEPPDWDKVVQPPCPDLASPRPPIPPASWLTSAANRPPCRGRQIPGTTIDPAALFRASFNALLRPRKRDERKAHGGLTQGRKPRLQAAAPWWRFHVPRQYLTSASSPPVATLTARAVPAKPLIFRSFRRETERLRCVVDFGHGRDQVRDQTQDLAIALGRDETHKICEAQGVGAKNLLAAAPSRGSPGSPCWSARTRPDRPHPAQRAMSRKSFPQN